MTTNVTIDIDLTPLGKNLLSQQKTKTVVSKHLGKAATKVGLGVAAKMRQRIRAGVGPANSQMTTDMKGSSKQLADTGRLFKAINFRIERGRTGDTIRVGVFRTSKAANVAKIVHDGTTQQVTHRMALFFRVLWLASRGRSVVVKSARGQELLSRSKGQIPRLREGQTLVIPPRPFAAETIQDPKTKTFIEQTYQKALFEAWEQLQK